MAREEKFSGAGRRTQPYSDRRRQPGQSLSEEIIELDAELLRLLTRRSALMSKLRKGRPHAASPGIVKSEKQIRGSWEEQCGRLSSSPRLSRQLFALINELDINPERAGEEFSPYNLSPSRQAADVNAAGPTSTMLTQLWLALAASSGRPTRLCGVPRSTPALEIARAFEQTGVHLEWEGSNLALDGRQLPDYYGKAIFLGDDLLTFYIFVFLGVSRPGKLRFTGGPSLKEADLGALARFLPRLGARLVTVLPGSKGLPVNLECSGELPDELTVPGDLPVEAVLALLLAALTWNRRLGVSLAEQSLPRQEQFIDLAKRAFKIVPGLGQALENSIDYGGYAVTDLDFPPEILIALDPILCAPILALPIFSGGRVKLSGKWVNLYQSTELIDLLKLFGLEIKADDLGVSSVMPPESVWPEVLELDELSACFHPLFWALNARLAWRAERPLPVRRWPAGADLELAEDFLAQTGYRLEKVQEGLLISPLEAEEFRNAASRSYGWPCPAYGWGLALSLAAFMRPNLKISNPDCVSKIMPDYWYFYNRLPSPTLQTASVVADDAPAERPARRRIKTDSLAEPEVREDYDVNGE